jgi:hypothetical protein
MFVFNQFGDLERCALRPGNVHGADGRKELPDPVVARYRGKVSRIYFALVPVSPIPMFTSISKPKASNMRSDFPRTVSCRNALVVC